jgi:hypothetical protein
VGIVAAARPLGRPHACFFSDRKSRHRVFFRPFSPKERPFAASLFAILSPDGDTRHVTRHLLRVIPKNAFNQKNNLISNTKNLNFIFLTSLKKLKNHDF